MNLSLNGFFEKFDKKQWVLVFLIGLLGFAIRAHLMRYELFFEFDSYLHARIVGFLLQNGYTPATEYMAYYFMQVAMPTIQVFWYIAGIIYKIVFFGAGYSKENLILLVKFLPAFYGGLIAAAAYFLGKEVYSRKAGYAMAFIAAVTPAFVYRTMAGFFEDDCLGFLWLVLGFIFLAKAMKSEQFDKKMVFNSVLSGIFFGTMAWSWGMYLLIPLITIPFFVLAFAKAVWAKDKKQMIAFVTSFAVAIAIFAASAAFQGDWIYASANYVSQALFGSEGQSVERVYMLLGTGIAIAAAWFIGFAVWASSAIKKGEEAVQRGSKFTNIVIGILLCVMLVFSLGLFLTKDTIFGAGGSVLGSSVGEENTGHQFFGGKYNVLIMLPVLALILIPLRVWREKKDYFSILLFIWILATLIMAWYKLKFTFVFGLSIAPAAGVVAEEIFFHIKNRSQAEKKIVLLCFGFLLLCGLAAGTIFVKTNIPNIELSNPTWKPALEWMKDNTPKDAKMFNWWNQGHWITFVGERAALNDNRNISKESDRDFALFFITEDFKTALKMVQTYDSDYVVFDASDFSSMVSMAQYAYDTTNYNDPRIARFFMDSGNGSAVPASFATPCSVQDTSLNCGGNVIPKDAWASIPSNWQQNPNDLFANRTPIFIYRDSESFYFYVFNDASNKTFAARLWFNEPDAMKYFDQVYAKEGVKIFKIKKDAIAQALNS